MIIVFTCMILIFTINSCSYFIDKFEIQYDILKAKKRGLSFVFSHNINGVTHPCGCRNFPLGGLPQVNGLFAKIKKKNDLIYIDTGDTFFPSSSLPKLIENSLIFTATNLSKGLEKLNLHYHVPGEQDLAKGVNFLKTLIEQRNYHLLISNLANSKKLPHKKWAFIQRGPHRIYFIGIVDQNLVPSLYKNLFTSSKSAIQKILKDLRVHGYHKDNPFHRLILLSHSGMFQDRILAKKFPQIDWIVGAHSQSFTNHPLVQGKTKIVQVLSRNHYIGEIQFSLEHQKSKDRFILHPIHDHLRDLIPNNRLIPFLIDHKKQLSLIQKEEQKKLKH